MAKVSVDDFVSALKEWTVVDVMNAIKAIETEFGVTAAAPVATAAAPAAGGAGAAGPEGGPKGVQVGAAYGGSAGCRWGGCRGTGSRADGVPGGADLGRRRQDRRDQGRARDHRPGPQGSQGPGGPGPQAGQAGCQPRRGRSRPEEAEGRRRRRRDQVAGKGIDPLPTLPRGTLNQWPGT